MRNFTVNSIESARTPLRLVVSVLLCVGSLTAVPVAKAQYGTYDMRGEYSPASVGYIMPSVHVALDTSTMTEMQDFQNRQTDKQLVLLYNKPCSPGPSLRLGAQARASFLAAHTNRADKFPYLGRFPVDFEGTTATDARMLHANASAIADFTPWCTAYFETLFSDAFTFPTASQGSFQVRQAYVVFGNLEATPWYAFIGKKNVSFGDMGTLSPFTQSVVWHYFGALAEGAGVGYTRGGFNATVTALNGGRGIRVVDSSSKGDLDNFAANIVHTVVLGDRLEIQMGAGYLHGTIYNADVPEHIDPDLVGPNNGAWDINTAVRYGRVQLAGEYVQTRKRWPAVDHAVRAYRLEAAYDRTVFCRPTRFALSWSEGIQGAADTEYEYNRQLVLGIGWRTAPNLLVTLEYVRSLGFAPLVNITTASDKSVKQDSAVLGIVLTI